MNEVAENTGPLVGRGSIVRLEAEIAKLPQVAFALRHFFAKGVCAREMTIPQGGVLSGRVHLQSQINICLKGDISIATENGIMRIRAPFTIATPAGTKRVGYAHEETIWTTILGTDLTDPQEIYETLTAASYEEYELFCKNLSLEGASPCLSQ